MANKITVTSAGTVVNANVTPDSAMYYSNKSKEWAISDKLIDNEDYSSKYYADESKKQADISTAKTTEVIESGNTAVSNIESARDNAITNVNTAGATQVALATEQATIATNKTSEVIESGNEALSNIDTAKNNAITTITTQETTSKTSLIDEGATQIGLIQNEGATQIANVQSTGFYMRDDKLYYINSQGEETEFKSGGSGLEVCDIGMALYVDETKGLRRYLNGQIVDINTNTQAFLNRLQQIATLHPSLLDTEENWQAAKTLSPFGQVGKFVFNYSGDDIVSVRLPRVVNVQGLFDLQNLGMTVSAGLPNITGSFGSGTLTKKAGTTDNSTEMLSTSGAILAQSSYGGSYINDTSSNSWFANGLLRLDASASNPIYGNSDTVQPEAIQYPYFIQIATGSETENNIINEIELNNPYSLFDSKYSDHELNNLSWLKSEGQWNAKAVYPTAYDELLTEYNNSASTTETEGSITFKRTPKGYKIALADQETAIDTKYTTDGIAWYYILDTTNEKFKLPRTKFGFEGLRTSVGDDIKAGLPNIKGALNLNPDRNVFQGGWGAFYRDGSGGRTWAAAETAVNSLGDMHFDASRSNPIYGNSNTVQSPATQMYLYFYVGETVQNANLIDAGRIGEQLATKTDMLQASGAGMPSNRYIDLTLGADGSTYTAPANGWYGINKFVTGNQYVFLLNLSNGMAQEGRMITSGMAIRLFSPVIKGQQIKVMYDAGGITENFRFIYAEGEV